MQRDAFIRKLAEEGFPEPIVVTREAGELNEHAHTFEAKALVLDGEIHIRVGGEERLYGVGDVFHLRANERHAERYGPNGVQYLVGRR
ncbi:cupin domain-containing protein [Paraburkholderia adhaesiva]|uniref:cupin domain-containing protein n=1 Tax=Paraburkholderia adhaesiva TaxID=2883244 RepID=UPI001F162808|nr:cupin domain-containing protein [Paraburkholderia adhaesiva]